MYEILIKIKDGFKREINPYDDYYRAVAYGKLTARNVEGEFIYARKLGFKKIW